MEMTPKERFNAAHLEWFKVEYPSAFTSGFYVPPFYPQVAKSNGLTQFIVKFLTWSGHRATRVNVSGRMVKGKYIPSSTRKGTADISATIKGRSVQIEIKTGSDKPRPEQLREQELERKAGGIYEFISTPEQFLEIYDPLVTL
jgi:hypothetical protein